MRMPLIVLTTALALSACAATQDQTQSGTQPSQTSAQYGVADSSGYQLPNPDWSSTSFYPPEFCWELLRMPQSHPDYYNIKYWCDRRDGRDGDFL